MPPWFNTLYERVFLNPGPLLSTSLKVGAIIVAAALAWWVFNRVMGRVEKKMGHRPAFRGDGFIFALMRRAGHYGIVILAGIGLLRLFDAPIVTRLFYALLILLLCNMARALTIHLFPYVEKRFAERTATRVDDVIVDLLKKFAGVIIYVTGIVLALDVLGLNIMPFVAGAGVVGIAVGFAAKDTLSNLIAGVLLIIDRPFEVGDRIEIWSAPKNSATWGDVVHIGLRATKIRTTDNIVIVIPNNEIMKRDIINYTTITDEIRVRIPVGIAYEADMGRAKEIIVRAAEELDWVMESPAPKVVVRGFGDSAVDLEARIWIGEPRRRMDTISHVVDRVKEMFDQEGIEIPYPKRTVYVKEGQVASGGGQAARGEREVGKAGSGHE